MRKNGEVTVKPDGRRRIYSITSLGKNKLKNIASHRDDLVDEMMTRINSVCAATSMKTMPDMVNLMVKHKMVIGKYELEINEMRREFMLAVSEGVPPKEIKAAIAEATRRIRSARK